jgi:hypothetical protein
MFMDCHSTKFQMPISIGSLVIVIKTKAKNRFHEAAILLFQILRTKLHEQKFQNFRRYVTIHHFPTFYYVALGSLPPHKFVRPPCCYYRLYEIRRYVFFGWPLML